MVMFDCCLSTYRRLVHRPSFHSEGAVVLFHVILMTNRHLIPLSSS